MDSIITFIRLIIGFGWIGLGIYFLYEKWNNPEKYKHSTFWGIFWLVMGITYLILYFILS